MRNGWRVLLCVALLTGGSGGAYAADWMLVAPHSDTWLVDSSAVAKATAPPDKQFVSGGITWNITYLDSGQGFDDPAAGAQRRARLEDTLAYVADVLNETATLDIEVQPSQFDGTGFLASAGTFYPVDASGFFEGTTLERVKASPSFRSSASSGVGEVPAETAALPLKSPAPSPRNHESVSRSSTARE